MNVRTIGSYFLLLCAFAASPARAATYYVDAQGGDDANAGTSPIKAWRTLQKVNATTFGPGDRLLFSAGQSWTGQLWPKGSGAANRPIVVGRYGAGAKPAIHGDGATAAVYLENQEHWEITNLEITNRAPAPGLRRGVLVRAKDFGRALQHVYLRGLDVHDVAGQLGADNVSKATGGIGFEITGTNVPARFDDVLVEQCTIRHVDNVGLYLWSDFSPHPRDPEWERTRNTNVRIRENALSDIGKNAIVVRASLAPVIERNVIEKAAVRFHGNAIYVFGCKDALIQFNEVSGTRFDRIEGAAFDSDYNSEGTVIQYNYSHANGGGLVNLCNNPESKPPRGFNDGTIVRYNLSQDETDRVIGFDGPVTNTQIYNNTIYVGPGLSPRIVDFDIFGKAPGHASNVAFRNNIIYNAGQGSYEWGEAKGVSFEANCFFGTHPANEPADPAKVVADPLFVAAGRGGNGFGSLENYKLRPGSPCANSGVVIDQHGGRDFFGNALYTGTPDRGAHEAMPVARSSQADIIPLWPEGVPGAIPTGGDEIVIDERVSNVHVPTLTAYPAPAGVANGTAAIVAPGGGYNRLAIGKEGGAVTRWLNSLGVSAFVLKYRLKEYGHPAPLQDVLRAVRLVRANAERWHIDPQRIGVIGFSAGGHLAASAGTLFDAPEGKTGAELDRVSARPDFLVLVYPAISLELPYVHAGSRQNLVGATPSQDLLDRLSLHKQVTERTPPTFLVHGGTDQSVMPENSVLFYLALRKATVPAELHVYEQGPHGFGLSPDVGPISEWPTRCADWLRVRGLLP